MKKKVIKMCLGYDEGTNEYLLTINYFLIVSFENDNSSGRDEMNYIQVGKQCKGTNEPFYNRTRRFYII